MVWERDLHCKGRGRGTEVRGQEAGSVRASELRCPDGSGRPVQVWETLGQRCRDISSFVHSFTHSFIIHFRHSVREHLLRARQSTEYSKADCEGGGMGRKCWRGEAS